MLLVVMLSTAAMLLMVSPAIAAEGVAELWHRVYDSGGDDVANGVAIDSQDNVIVAGYTTNASGKTDFYTIKYDKNGDEIWSKTYDGGNNDAAYDVAVDSQNSILVTGYTTNAGTGSAFYTIKYNSYGDEIWSKTYDSPKTDWAWGVAVDSYDNVIVTGQRRDSGCDYYTIKYNSDGDELWSKEYMAGGMCEVFDVAVDSHDNIIVTGQCGFPSGKYHTVKYDRDSNLLWVATYGIPGDNEGKSVTTDSQDNVIVTGISGPQVDHGYIFRYRTIKYDINGNELWKRTYFGGIDDWPWGVAVDSQDDVIVTGHTTKAGGDADYYTIEYDSNGTELWHKTYGTGLDDGANDVAVDSQDNVIVTGSIRNTDGNNDYCTIKYVQQMVHAGTAALYGASTPRASPSPQQPPQLPPSDVRLNNISVSPGQAESGQPVTVLANLVNTGASSGSYNVMLRINGRMEQQRTVEVSPGTAYPVRFTVIKTQPGTYDVAIEGQRTSFMVVGDSTSRAPASGGLIALTAMAVLMLATVVVLMISFRRPA